MPLDPQLLEILACPEDKGPLYYLPQREILYNPRLHRVYEIRDEIPVMLVEEARSVDEAEHGQIMGEVAAQGLRPTFEEAS